MSSGVARSMSGGYEGTGAEISIRTVGFRPKYVKVINTGGGPDMLEWTDGMPDAAALKSVAAGTNTYITSLGITPLSDGFKIGADTDVNVSGEKGVWVAFE